MEAITNIIMPTFDEKAIDRDFDIFCFRTTRQYFPKGARLLDLQEEGIKFRSIAFEKGRKIYAICRKDDVNQYELANAIADGTVTIERVYAKDVDRQDLLRLFLFSLNCPTSEGASFNNLSGKLYIYVDGLRSSGKVLKVLSFDINDKMCLIIGATSFTPANFFDKTKILDEPKYVFSKTHLSFRRVFGTVKDETVYVRKTRFGKKTEIPFLRFNKPEQVGTKSYWAYKILGWLQETYGSYLSFELKRAPVVQKVSTRRDVHFFDKARCNLLSLPCRVINLIGEEYEEKAMLLKEALEKALDVSVGYSTNLERNVINFCLIHEASYYLNSHEQDPQKSFPRDFVVQCVAVEEGFVKVAKGNNAVIETIIKEAAIKNDIVNNGHILLDHWPSFGYEDDWTFVTMNNGNYFAMIIHPNGSFEFKKAKEGLIVFNDKQLNALAASANDVSAMAKTVVKDSNGNVFAITGTPIYILPNKDIFASPISRSKESRDHYLAGVVDVNLFEIDGEIYYNAGLIGAGMNTDVSKAAPLYKVTAIAGENVIQKLLETMSVTFVKYNSFTVLPYPFKYLREYIELN